MRGHLSVKLVIWLLHVRVRILRISGCRPSISIYGALQLLPGLGLLHKTPPSPFSALLLNPLIPSSCNASLWTTSAHLVLGLPTGLVAQKFQLKTIFGIFSSSILVMWPPQCKWGLRSSGVLRSVCWYLFADVRPLDCPETSVNTNIRWVTSQKNQDLTSQEFSNPEPSSSVWVRRQCEVTLRDPPLSLGGGGGSLPELPSLPQPCSNRYDSCRFEKSCATILPTDCEAPRLWLIYVWFWRQKSGQRTRCSD